MGNKKDEYARNFASKLIEQLKENTAIWQKPWKGGLIRQAHNPVSKTVYKGANAFFLMVMQHHLQSDDSRWMTFKQALSLGCQVRKGEKGTLCRYWNRFGYRTVRDNSGKIAKDSQGNPLKERYPLERPFMKNFSVFHASQIENMPPVPAVEQVPQWDVHKITEKLISNSKAQIVHHKFDSAYYDNQKDTVNIPHKGMFDSSERYYGTILHELCHWTGHDTRLDRDIHHPFGSTDYAREELRAEIGAYMLSCQLGLPFNPGHHISYTAGWIKVLEDDPHEIFRATQDAHKISCFLRGCIEEDLTSEKAA